MLYARYAFFFAYVLVVQVYSKNRTAYSSWVDENMWFKVDFQEWKFCFILLSTDRSCGPGGHHPGSWSTREPDQTTAPIDPPECKQLHWGGVVLLSVYISCGHSSECCSGKSVQAVGVMMYRRQCWGVTFTAPHWFEMGVNLGCSTETSQGFKPRQSWKKILLFLATKLVTPVEKQTVALWSDQLVTDDW